MNFEARTAREREPQVYLEPVTAAASGHVAGADMRDLYSNSFSRNRLVGVAAPAKATMPDLTSIRSRASRLFLAAQSNTATSLRKSFKGGWLGQKKN